MAKTSISWTDDTWNPIVGCSIKSTGCKNCYAMRAAWRMSHNPKTPQYHGTAKLANGKPVWTGRMSFAEKAFLKPLKTRKPTVFFVNSMGDLFHEDVPDAWIDGVFAVMTLSPQHIFQVLTKRPDRMREYINAEDRGREIDMHCEMLMEEHSLFDPLARLTTDSRATCLDVCGEDWPLPNLHLGVSVEDQPTADERIPLLMDTPAAIRWISAEPLLGPVDLIAVSPNDVQEIDCLRGHSINPDWSGCVGLDWVVVGGESGPGARPMLPDWARSLRDQCKAARVPFHFKQWGAWGYPDQVMYWTDDPVWQRGKSDTYPIDRIHVFDDNVVCQRVGKKAAGRRLDGELHDGCAA